MIDSNLNIAGSVFGGVRPVGFLWRFDDSPKARSKGWHSILVHRRRRPARLARLRARKTAGPPGQQSRRILALELEGQRAQAQSSAALTA
jgi:hypothetical protein